MTIQNQVVSLEIAKQLKKLWIKEKGAFTYVLCTDTDKYKLEDFDYFHWAIRNYRTMGFDWSDRRNGIPNYWEMFYAYTATELWEILPYNVKYEDTLCSMYCLVWEDREGNRTYSISYFNLIHKKELNSGVFYSEAEARAMMIIKLIELWFYIVKTK